MPIFDYHCTTCDREVEVFIRGNERARCPECESEKLQRLMSVPAGHVAGSKSLPVVGPGCPPADAPPCGTGCCRLPQ